RQVELSARTKRKQRPVRRARRQCLGRACLPALSLPACAIKAVGSFSMTRVLGTARFPQRTASHRDSGHGTSPCSDSPSRVGFRGGGNGSGASPRGAKEEARKGPDRAIVL